MDSITQGMKYRQSILVFAAKHGVSRASRKYNKCRSYIYFWLARYNGDIASLACRSRQPHHHPRQHTASEIQLLRAMCRRNPALGRVELWCRLRKRGYTRSLILNERENAPMDRAFLMAVQSRKSKAKP